PPRDASRLAHALRSCCRATDPDTNIPAGQVDWRGILVTSANGARAIVTAMPPGVTPPPFFAVGAQTAEILRQQGWSVHVPPTAAGGTALAQAVIQWEQAHHDTPGPAADHYQKRFLFPQAEQGREELATQLQEAGYSVEKVVAYRAEPITALPPVVQNALANGEVDAVLFFSGRTAQAFMAALPPCGAAWLAGLCIAAISPVTAEAIRQLGQPVTVIATEPSSSGLLTALHHHWHPPTPREK
ncbi:MAG: uroporphyrinogen-III synthase, partial [Magnetococcus sp. DMHC-8]